MPIPSLKWRDHMAFLMFSPTCPAVIRVRTQPTRTHTHTRIITEATMAGTIRDSTVHLSIIPLQATRREFLSTSVNLKVSSTIRKSVWYGPCKKQQQKTSTLTMWAACFYVKSTRLVANQTEVTIRLKWSSILTPWTNILSTINNCITKWCAKCVKCWIKLCWKVVKQSAILVKLNTYILAGSSNSSFMKINLNDTNYLQNIVTIWCRVRFNSK